jgi:hypothetical protein
MAVLDKTTHEWLVAQAPVGSRWYAWGDHIVVTELTRKEGEPAVFTSAKRGSKLVPIPTSALVELLLKYGVRQES